MFDGAVGVKEPGGSNVEDYNTEGQAADNALLLQVGEREINCLPNSVGGLLAEAELLSVQRLKADSAHEGFDFETGGIGILVHVVDNIEGVISGDRGGVCKCSPNFNIGSGRCHEVDLEALPRTLGPGLGLEVDTTGSDLGCGD